MKRLLGVVAVTLAAIGTFEPVGEAGELSTLACYVALAYDVAPLADPSLPDTVAASPECAAPTQPLNDRNRGGKVVPSKVRNRTTASTGTRCS